MPIGQTTRKAFTVTPSPPYFDSAPRYTSPRLGITIRNVTYEVRRQLQMRSGDPGVVISKITAGSRASTAGIKPYELITHVNGNAIANVRAFERQTTDADDLELSIKRMTRSRQVRIR